ncbi:MAG: 50S ribosomal protein L11 methyltransferase, partial [Congregibacter sp.]|nr:50S ribosomal protein L11 methyltransferase [Congregibacter sp.]
VQLLAVDNDPQALTATADNAGRNSIAPQRLDIALPENVRSRDWQGRADLVVANILAGPLADLSGELCSFLASGGQLVLAGLLDTQADALIEHYAPRIELSILQQQAEWVCLAGKLP